MIFDEQGLESMDGTVLCLDNEIVVPPPLIIEDPPGSGDFIIVQQNVTILQENEAQCSAVQLPDVMLALSVDSSGTFPLLDVLMFSTEAVAGSQPLPWHPQQIRPSYTQILC